MANAKDGQIYVRRAEPSRVADVEEQPTAEWLHNALLQMTQSLQGLRRVMDDRTKPVDEYVPQNASSSSNSVTVMAQFDAQMAERIESIFYWGPPAATGTIQLGDMTINIVIPARGWD